MFGKSNRTKKALAGSSEFELDFGDMDFDFSMPDFDSQSEENKKSVSNRNPVLKATSDFAKGVGSNALDRNSVKNFVRHAIPREYGDFIDTAEQLEAGAQSIYFDASERLRQVKSQSRSFMRRAVPLAEKTGIDAFVKIAQKLGGQDEDYYGQWGGHSKEKQRQGEIDSTLGELFKQQSRLAKLKQQSDEDKEHAMEAITQARFENQMTALASIDTTLRSSFQFTNKNTFNFYRKSIELSLRKYHALMDIHQEQIASNRGILQALNDIKLNTALPEYVKQQTKEAIGEIARQKAIGRVENAIFGQGSFIGDLVSNLSQAVKMKVGNFSDMFGMAIDPLQDIVERVSEQDEYDWGEFGIEKDSKSKTAGKLISSTLAGQLGKKLNPYLQRTKLGKRLSDYRSKASFINENMGDMLLRGLRDGSIRQSLTRNAGEGTIVDSAWDAMQTLVEATVRGTNTNKVNIGSNYADLTTVSGVSDLAKRSTTTVIPGYLSRILRELTMMRTGKESPLLEYNYRSGQFVTSRQNRDSIERLAVGRNNYMNIESGRSSLMRTVANYDSEFMSSIPEAEQRLFTNMLINASANGNIIDYAFLTNPENYQGISQETTNKLIHHFTERNKEAQEDKGNTYFTDISSQARRTGKSITLNKNTIQGMINAGYSDHLKAMGVIDNIGRIDKYKYLKFITEYQPSQDIANSENFSSIMGFKATPTSKDDLKDVLLKQTNTLQELSEVIKLSQPKQQLGEEKQSQIDLLSSINQAVMLQNEISSNIMAKIDTMTVLNINKQMMDMDSGSTGTGASRQTATRNFLRESLNYASSALRYGRSLPNTVKEYFKGNPRWASFIRDTSTRMASVPLRYGQDLLESFSGKKVFSSERARELVSSTRTKAVDIYKEGVAEPIVKARDLISGKYRDSKGKVITSLQEIKSNLYDEEGNIVATLEEINSGYILDKGKYVAVRTLNFIKDNSLLLLDKTIGVLTAPYQAALGKLLNVKDFALNQIDRLKKTQLTDVYLLGKREPILFARKLKNGQYFSKRTGKPIFSIDDIDDDVVDSEGNIVTTLSELSSGIIDKYGKPIASNFKHLIRKGVAFTKWTTQVGIGAARLMRDVFKGMTFKLTSGFRSVFGNVVNKITDPVTGAIGNAYMQRETNELLSSILALLDNRLPKRLFGDKDGDGDVDGSIADLKRKEALRKAKEALTPREKKTKEKKEKEGSLLSKLASYFPGLGSIFGDGGDDDTIIIGGRDRDRQHRRRSRIGKRPSRLGRLGRGLGTATGAATTGKFGRLTGAMGNVGKGTLGALGTGAGLLGRGIGATGSALSPLLLKGLGLGGLLFSGTALANDLADGNYDAALMDAGMLGVSALTSGVSLSGMLSGAGALGSAAISGASALGGAALSAGTFLATNPIGWAILGTAALGTAGYFAYKWYKNNKINEKVRARMMLYGLDPEDKEHIQKLLTFEDMMESIVIQDVSGSIRIDESKVKPKEILDLFGFEQNDAEMIKRWTVWFEQRFKPAFSKTKRVLMNINPKYKIADGYELRNEDEKQYYNGIKPSDGEYTLMLSPFKDLPQLTKTGKDARVYIEDQLKKGSSQEISKLATIAKATLATTPVGQVALLSYEKLKKSEEKENEARRQSFKDRKALQEAKERGEAYKAKRLTMASTSSLESVRQVGEVEPFDAIRYKLYGLNELNKDKIGTILTLEKMLLKDIQFTNNIAKYSGDIGYIANTISPYFQIGGYDEGGKEILTQYLQHRFLPVYLGFLTGLKRETNNIQYKGAQYLNPSIALMIYREMAGAKTQYDNQEISVWNFTLNPWQDGMLNSRSDSIKDYVTKIEKMSASKDVNEAKIRANAKEHEAKEEARRNLSTFDRVKQWASDSWTTFKESSKANWESLKQVYSGTKDTVVEKFNNFIGKETKLSIDKAKIRDKLWEEMQKAGITSKNEVAAFLANVDHETGGLKWLIETSDGHQYNGRKSLGNTQPGDGPRFKGRGLIQLTGRDNYQAFSNDIGRPDIMSDPTKVATDPELLAKSAIWFWTKRKPKLREAAQAGDFKLVRRLVNGGYNGLDDTMKKVAGYLQGQGTLWKNTKLTGTTTVKAAPVDEQVNQPNNTSSIDTNTGTPVTRALGAGNKPESYDEMMARLGVKNARGRVNEGISTATWNNTSSYSTTSNYNLPQAVGNLVKDSSYGKTVSNISANQDQAGVSMNTAAFIKSIDPKLVELGKKNTTYLKGVILNGMDKDFMTLFYAMVGEYVQRGGKRKVQVNSAFRTRQQQEALFAKYGPGRAARPGNSAHESGRAIDVNTINTNELISMGLAKKYGFYRSVRGETWHLENRFVPRKGKSTAKVMMEDVKNAKTTKVYQEKLKEKNAGKQVPTMDTTPASPGTDLNPVLPKETKKDKGNKRDIFNENVSPAQAMAMVQEMNPTLSVGTLSSSSHVATKDANKEMNSVDRLHQAVKESLSGGSDSNLSSTLASTAKAREQYRVNGKVNELNQIMKKNATSTVSNTTDASISEQSAIASQKANEALVKLSTVSEAHYQEAKAQTKILKDILVAISKSSGITATTNAPVIKANQTKAPLSHNPVNLAKGDR